MSVPRELFDGMVTHAREDDPNECCGLIGGSPGEALTLYRATNAEASPFRYSLAPAEQLDLMNRIEDAGEELVGIYHSHTRSGAWPSQTDINLAGGWPGTVWFIISLEDPDSPDVKAFTIDGSEVGVVDIQVE
jgi:proteasome lid subunit RPN8/RPN11